MDDFLSSVLTSTKIEDLEPGSVFKQLIESERIMKDQNRRIQLIKFLSKLDGRFKKHINPWAEVELAQRYFSKL